MNAGFNLFRFGDLTNASYLDPVFQTPGHRVEGDVLRVTVGCAEWGLLWFWMSACLVLLAAAVVVVQQMRARQGRRAWLPTGIVLGVAIANTVGLSSWFAPFGWLAWGPRLSLPLTPAVIVAVAITGGPMLTRLIGRVLTNAVGFAAVALVVVAFAIPQVGVIWNPAAEAALATLDTACPVGASVQADATYYYGCVQHGAWRTKPLVLWEAARTGAGTARLAELALAISVVSLLLIARRRLGSADDAGDNDRVHPDAVEAADVAAQA